MTMNTEKERAEFEAFRDDRNAKLTNEGHRKTSKFIVNNAHYPTWQAARAPLLEEIDSLRSHIWRLEESIRHAHDNEPEYHDEGMGCGLEDRCITDRYEAMRYGWDEAISRMYSEVLPPTDLLHDVTQEEIAESIDAINERSRLRVENEELERAQSFQDRVAPWMLECFGPKISDDKAERNHRFLEESLELVQSLGCTKSEALQLVDYVYGRPVGDPRQEVGGVRVTLAALCNAALVDEDDAAETELARIWTKVPEIRAKQAAKPEASPLPEHTQQPVNSGWQPIETVPIDEDVLLADKTRPGEIHVGVDAGDAFGWFTTDGKHNYQIRMFSPTHWMPLPQPPGGGES